MTITKSGELASFYTVNKTPIKHLRVYFSPKQAGEGDPSPENVRPIEGWNGVTVEQRGKNLWGGSAMKEAIANIFPIISTNNNIITYSNTGAQQADGAILFSSFKPNTQYTLVLTYSKSTNVYTHIAFLYSDGSFTMHNRIAPDDPNTKTTEVYTSKANKTLTAIIRKADEYSNVTLYCDESGLFEGIITKSEFESYRGNTINYEFGVLGKNKLDKNNYKYLNSSIICFGGSASAEEVDGSLFLKAGTYTFSINTTANVIFASDANKKNIVLATNTNTATFTLPESIAIRMGCFIQDATDEEMLAYNYQLELGSVATGYESYDSNHIVYSGYADLITGEVQQEWAHVIIDENTLFYMATRQNNSGNYFYKEFNNKPDKQCLYTAGKLSESMRVEKSNQFEIRNSWGEESIDKFSTWAYASADTKTTIRFGFPSELNITSVDAAKSWFMENGSLEIIYPLAAPITYSLASTQLQTLLGRNNIWSNADRVEIEYDLAESNDILYRRRNVLKQYPHIITPAANGLINFNTDIKAPLKQCKVYFNPIQEGEGDPSPENVRAINGWTGINVTISPTQQATEGQTLALDWTDEAGTIYGGHVDLVTGEVWTTIGSTVFNGTQPIKYFKWQTKTYTSGVLYDPVCTPGMMITPQTQIQPYLMSDKLEAKYYNAVPSADYMCFGAYYNTQYGIIMKLPVEVVVDTETINAYLAANPITIVYTLAVPALITTLTPTQLKTLRGINNIWSNSNGNIELSYWTH